MKQKYWAFALETWGLVVICIHPSIKRLEAIVIIILVIAICYLSDEQIIDLPTIHRIEKRFSEFLPNWHVVLWLALWIFMRAKDGPVNSPVRICTSNLKCNGEIEIKNTKNFSSTNSHWSKTRDFSI